jgi:hypothetical protein
MLKRSPSLAADGTKKGRSAVQGREDPAEVGWVRLNRWAISTSPKGDALEDLCAAADSRIDSAGRILDAHEGQGDSDALADAKHVASKATILSGTLERERLAKFGLPPRFPWGSCSRRLAPPGTTIRSH